MSRNKRRNSRSSKRIPWKQFLDITWAELFEESLVEFMKIFLNECLSHFLEEALEKLLLKFFNESLWDSVTSIYMKRNSWMNLRKKNSCGTYEEIYEKKSGGIIRTISKEIHKNVYRCTSGGIDCWIFGRFLRGKLGWILENIPEYIIGILLCKLEYNFVSFILLI